jgi:hypothetical protein
VADGHYPGYPSTVEVAEAALWAVRVVIDQVRQAAMREGVAASGR